ncbi:MAG: ATP-binding protein, partial [Desulfuromonadales bacterium]
RSVINNALEATSRGGRLEIRTTREGDEVHLLLSDTGTGMSPEILQAAGNPFFSTKEKGSGLGLPLCVRILEEHGAKMEIRSDPGAGTQLLVRLPIPVQEGT